MELSDGTGLGVKIFPRNTTPVYRDKSDQPCRMEHMGYFSVVLPDRILIYFILGKHILYKYVFFCFFLHISITDRNPSLALQRGIENIWILHPKEFHVLYFKPKVRH